MTIHDAARAWARLTAAQRLEALNYIDGPDAKDPPKGRAALLALHRAALHHVHASDLSGLARRDAARFCEDTTSPPLARRAAPESPARPALVEHVQMNPPAAVDPEAG